MGRASVARQPPRGLSVRFHLAARLAFPVACVVALCGLAMYAALGGHLSWLRWLGSGPARQHTLSQALALAGAALVVALLTIAALSWFARRLAREIAELTAAARDVADDHLPRVARELRDGSRLASSAAAGPGRRAEPAAAVKAGPPRRAARAPRKTAEIVAAMAAIGSIERTAVEAATAEARLRDGLREILMSLGRRNQSLLHRQLKIIDQLEQRAANPAELADLFTLDHLTTRMRRHAESLTILSGASPVRSWSGPVPVSDVIRAAVAEVEDYKRVIVATDTEESVAASAVTDMIHLLAELIENATLFSPSSTQVEVRRTGQPVVDLTELLGRDAEAAVLHLDGEAVGHPLGTDLDPRGRRGEQRRVLDQLG